MINSKGCFSLNKEWIVNNKIIFFNFLLIVYILLVVYFIFIVCIILLNYFDILKVKLEMGSIMFGYWSFGS